MVHTTSNCFTVLYVNNSTNVKLGYSGSGTQLTLDFVLFVLNIRTIG